MAEWSYMVQRLGGEADGEIFETELPLTGFVRGRALSAPPTASGKIPFPLMRLTAPDGLPLIKKWHTAIYPVVDNIIRAGYIVANNSWVGEEHGLTLVGFSALPKGQPYQGDTEWPNADPMDVFRHIWSHQQSLPGSNIHMQVGDATSPIRLPAPNAPVAEGEFQSPDKVFRLNPWTTFDMGDAIDRLAVAGGFDWRERHAWSSGEFPIDHFIDLGYPRLGGRKHDPRLVYGENVLEEPSIDDGGIDDFATDIVLLGAGEGRDRIRGYAGRPSTGIRRTKVIEDRDVDSVGQANKVARQWLARYRGDPKIGQVTVVQHANADIHALEPGDEIQYYAETPHVTLDQWVKIVDIKDTPDQEDVAIITVVPA